METQHGGKREGAGRKPLKLKRQALTVRIGGDEARRLKLLCKRHDLSQARMIEKMINREES